MSANANLVELVRELDLGDLKVAMTILNDDRFPKEEARLECKAQFPHFGNECPHALVDIEHDIELIDTIENFQQDFFLKLMILDTLYGDDEKILAKLRKLWGLYNGYYSGISIYAPEFNLVSHEQGMGLDDLGFNRVSYDIELAKDVDRFLRSFRVFKPHVHRKIDRIKGAEACDVTVIFLGDNDSPLSVEDQNKAKEENIPLLIKRQGRWSMYGNVQGVWQERTLDNLREEENKALNDPPFNLTEIARIKVDKSKFPMKLKARLRTLHAFSTQIERNDLESFIERLLNDLSIQRETEELELMDNTLQSQVNSLIENVKKVMKNDTLLFVDKLEMIYGLYRGYQAALQPDIRAFLYPDNQPSIEKLRIDIEGELQKTLGAYIRAKVAPEDRVHFTNEFIQQRLMASYLKMCMFYITSQLEKSLKAQFTEEYRGLIQFALFQAAETSSPIDKETFLKRIDSYCTTLEMIKATGFRLKNESASLFKDVDALLSELEDHCLREHHKLYKKMRKLKGESIKVLGEKISCLQKIMDEASVQFEPLVQRRIEIETRWAEIQKLSQTEKALQELQRHVNPQSLEESLPVKSSQKRGVLKFFAPSSKKADNTKTHPQSLPVSSAHDSVATKQPVSLPASMPKQSGAIEPSKKLPTTPSISTSSSSSTVVFTPPPGLGATSAAVVTPTHGFLATSTTPSTMLISRHGLNITPLVSSKLEPLGALGRNPIIDENPIDMEAKTVSEFVDSDLDANSDTISENLSPRGTRPH